MKNYNKTIRKIMPMTIVLLAAVFTLGCIGASPGVEPATTTATVQPIPQTDTTLATATTIAAQPVSDVDSRAICLEARANRTIYERCKMAAVGELSLPQSELRMCAQIQQHAGTYAATIFHGLKFCVGIQEGSLGGDTYLGAYFCKDLGQPDRDDCYFSVRLCDQIEDYTLKSQCQSSLELKKL